MKKVILCIVCVFGWISFSTAVKKEKDSDLKTVYVSVNEALEKTGEQGKIRLILDKEQKRIQLLIQKKSKKLNTEAVKIRKEMALLSENEKLKKYESIQKMQLMMEQFVKEKEREFQQKENNLRSTVINQIKVVVNSVAKKEKVDVILNKDGTLWVRPNMDLTSKVISMYKKKYK